MNTLAQIPLNDPTWGRPELRKYIVARTLAGNGWPLSDAMDRARHDYDRGRVEMCQGRVDCGIEGVWLLQYAIPRKHPETRAAYFSPRVGSAARP